MVWLGEGGGPDFVRPNCSSISIQQLADAVLFFSSRVAVRCGCGEIGIRGGLKIRWGFPRCRFESGQPHQFIFLQESKDWREAAAFAKLEPQ